MNSSDSTTVQSIERSRRKLLKDGTAFAASAAITALFVQGCKSGANDQKNSSTAENNARADQNDFLTELAQKLGITVPLLKQHRSFLVFWLMLTTNPSWLDPNDCKFPDPAQLETDLGGDLKAAQIQAVFTAIQNSDDMRVTLFNVGTIFNDSPAKDSSGFSNAEYGDKTCPPGLEIILSLYQAKSTFATANPSCLSQVPRSKIKPLKAGTRKTVQK